MQSLYLMPAPARPSRRPGRPRVSDDHAARELHVQAATMRYVHLATVPEVAKAFGVAPRTVHNWCALALTYNDPRCERLRWLVG
jgi:transposase-like protein